MKATKVFLNKVFLVPLFCLLFPALVWAFPVNNVREEPLTSGAILVRQNVVTGAGTVKVYMIKVDLGNEYIHVDTIVGKDGTLGENQAVTSMARSSGAVAAINGDFFQMGACGRPIGLTFRGGVLISSPAMRTDMFGFGLTNDKIPMIDIFDFKGRVTASNGTSCELFGINKPGYNLLSGGSSDQNRLIMYTPLWGEKTRANISGIDSITEAVVVNDVVTAVHTGKGGTSIPRGGHVLSGHGSGAEYIIQNLPVGSGVTVEQEVSRGGNLLWPGRLVSAIGGQALLVDNGKIPSRFTQTISGRHARTAVGISEDKQTLYLVAVEKSGGSPGMEQRELAEYLVSQGVWRAVNVDGGGSTTVAARHLGDSEVSLINAPQAGSQRSVPNAIGVYSTAPKGMFRGLILQGPQVVLTGVGASYSIKAYDEYFNPYGLSVNEVSFSAPQNYGEFKGNVFMPNTGGKVELVAEYNNEQSRLQVEVLGPDKMAGLVIEPSSLQLQPGQTATLKSKVKMIDGRSFDLEDTHVDWSVSKDMGSVKDGVFTASNSVGAGKITASFEGKTVDVPVEIRTGDAVAVELEPAWPVEAWVDAGLRAYFPANITNSIAEVKLTRGSATGVSLPKGLVPLKVLDVKIADDNVRFNDSWQLHWEFPNVSPTDRIALFKFDDSIGEWVEQPSDSTDLTVEDPAQTKLLTARLWTPGSYVAVLDERPLPQLTDIPGHWSEAAVNEMAARNIITGYPEGVFKPEEGVTRAEFVAMLSRALGWGTLKQNGVEMEFIDEIQPWAVEHISVALLFGVVEGYTDGTFLPDKKINRSEMAVMIDRALELRKDGRGGDGNAIYRDSHLIPEWARDAVTSASNAGLLQGSEGLFSPNKGATRAEAATVIKRALEKWVGSGLVYTK